MPGRQTVLRTELWGVIQVSVVLTERPTSRFRLSRSTDERYHTQGGARIWAKWRLVIDLVLADRRAQWQHGGYQGHVTLGGRLPANHQAKQKCISPRAFELFGGRRGRGGGEASATQHESGTYGQKNVWLAGDINELDLLLEEEERNTLFAIGRLVEELAHQGHLFVRHKEGLKCQACNVYRDRQSNFWSRTLCVPRPRAADVISRFRNKKRQCIKDSTDKLVCIRTDFSTFSSPATMPACLSKTFWMTE